MNERIKEIREYLKLTRAAFGEKLGVSGDVINNMERGRVEIKEDRIKLLCSVFDINETWLRTGEGDRFKQSDMDFGYICGKIDVNDPKAKEAIMRYYELTEDDKKLFWKFLEHIVDNEKKEK